MPLHVDMPGANLQIIDSMEVQNDSAYHKFGRSRAGFIAWALVYWGCAALFLSVAWIDPRTTKAIPTEFLLVAAGFCALFGSVSLAYLRTRDFEDSWIAAIRTGAVIVRLGDASDDPSEKGDPQSLELLPSDVKEIRQVKIRRIVACPDGHSDRGTFAQDFLVLEFALSRELPDSARERLDVLADQAANQVIWDEPPIALSVDNRLRICWRAPRLRLTPNISFAIELATTSFKVVPAGRECEDFTIQTLEKLPEEAQGSRIRQLASFRPKLAAHTVESLRKCTAEEASEYCNALLRENGTEPAADL